MGNTVSQNLEARRQREAEEAANYRALYGEALPSVELLRKRGYIVTREGKQIRVGNKLLAPDEVMAMAGREAGVAGLPVRRVTATASGLRVGQAMALTPKKPAPATAAPKKSTPSAAAPPMPRRLAGAAAASAAKAAEHSTDLGTRPRVVWLGLELLVVDPRYQREINQHGQAHINRILKAFNRFGLICPVTHSHGGNLARDVGQPFPTLTTSKGGHLAFITAAFGERDGQLPRVHDLELPMPTIPAQGSVRLAEAGDQYDILFRMLHWRELARAMSFSDADQDYEFAGTKTEITKQIGNAVPVRTARALVGAALWDMAA